VEGIVAVLKVPKKERLTWKHQAQALWTQKGRSPGSLGRLEEISVRLCELQQTLKPEVSHKRLIIFAASHGIAAEGVSKYSSEITGNLVCAVVEGSSAVNVIARTGRIGLHVIDVGVDAPRGYCPEQPPFSYRSVRRGTRSFLKEPAMSAEELSQAFEAGREAVRRAKEDGVQLLGLGEMGFGSTTSAAALMCAMLKCTPEESVGRGLGIDEGKLKHKTEVVARAIAFHQGQNVGSPIEWLQRVGGYEIAALTGAILEAHKLTLPLVLDGFVVTAAALMAHKMDPSIERVCFYAHRSGEREHGRILERLRIKPLLDLGMRLGEGTGAALAMSLMETAARLLCEMGNKPPSPQSPA
jgi:nicotinate-nucleotide--dimethylbenzimidazole phosphoribosyltransferase